MQTKFSLVALTLIVGFAAPAMAAINSQTDIPPGQTFLLGGGQPGAFRVEGRNAGSVPVTIRSELKGQVSFIATLAPGQTVDVVFQAGQMALFENGSTTKTARMSLKLTQQVQGLGMRYKGPGADRN